MEGHNAISASSSRSLMALVTVLLICIHVTPCSGARFIPTKPTNNQFIKTSCSTTTFPTLCINSLSSYASTIQNSPMQLAHTALSVALGGAHSMKTEMTTIVAKGGMSHGVAAAMSDCMDTVSDSMDELQESMGAMGTLGGKNFAFQINSIQTWVSAALTDDDTCMDGFASKAMSGEVKTAVTSHVGNVAQLTSNALAFINALANAVHSSTP